MSHLRLIDLAPDSRPTLADLAKYLTCDVEAAAAAIGIGRGAAYAAARRGEIPTIRLGHRLLVPVPRLIAMFSVAAEAEPTRGRHGIASGGHPYDQPAS